jgi:HK97 family phage major capsid protein
MPAIEVKDSGTAANLSPEAKAALHSFGQTVEALKASVDEQISGVKRRLDDVVTKEKVDRISDDLTALKAAINEEIAAMKRANAGGGGERDSVSAKISEIRRAERKGFDQWVRKGDARGLQRAAEMAMSAEYQEAAKAVSEHYGVEVKDLSTVVAQDGGYLIEPQRELEMIEIIEELSDMRQICNVVPMTTQELEVPVDKGGFEAAWMNELGTRAATTTGTVDKRKFVVEEVYALPKVTLAMLEDSRGFDVESWMTKKVTKAMARKEGQAFINGDGNNKPKGILQQSIVADGSWAWGKIGYIATGAASNFKASFPGNSTGPVAASNGADCLFDLIYALPRAYRTNCDWVMNRKSLRDTRKLKDGDGQYLFRDALTDSGLITQILGYPVLEAEDMPDIAANAFPIAFGDFEEGYNILDRLGIQVRRDDMTQPGFVIFHFRRRVGGDVADYQAIKLLKVAAS